MVREQIWNPVLEFRGTNRQTDIKTDAHHYFVQIDLFLTRIDLQEGILKNSKNQPPLRLKTLYNRVGYLFTA